MDRQNTGFGRNNNKWLWLVIGGLVLAVVVWYICKNSKNKGLENLFGAAPVRQVGQYQSGPPQGAQCPGHQLTAMASAASAGQSQPTPMGFHPYGSNVASAYQARFPSSEDPQGAALFPKSPGAPKGCGGNYDGCPLSVSPGCNSDKWGYQLNVDHLMPASWRGTAGCGAGSVDETEWSKFAPSKSAFSRYITASGSARLSLNTRSPLGRQVGTSLLLRPSPPLPLSAKEHEFNDSSFRADLVMQSTGMYPENTDC